jgi:DNA-binding NarL/FixJ family response regulator
MERQNLPRTTPSSPSFILVLNYSALSRALGMATPRTFRQRVRSPLRGRKLVDVRMAIARVLHERGYTYEEIARELNRAQSLIHHYVKTHEAVVETDAAYRQMVELVRRAIGEQQGVVSTKSVFL